MLFKLILPLVFFLGASAHAQFLATHCKSSDENLVVSGYQDATSVLMTMKLDRVSPPLTVQYDSIDANGNSEPTVALHRGAPVTVPFPEGQRLVFAADLQTAEFFEAEGSPSVVVRCCQDGGAKPKCP